MIVRRVRVKGLYPAFAGRSVAPMVADCLSTHALIYFFERTVLVRTGV